MAAALARLPRPPQVPDLDEAPDPDELRQDAPLLPPSARAIVGLRDDVLQLGPAPEDRGQHALRVHGTKGINAPPA